MTKKKIKKAFKKMLIFDDAGSSWNRRFIIEGKLDYNKLLGDTKDELYYGTLDSLNASSLNKVNGEEFLTAYLKFTERKMWKIISKYNLYELFFWTHRIPPTDAFGVQDLTILLYREVLTLSIMKYGKMAPGSISKDKYNQWMPSYIINRDPLHAPWIPQILNVLSDCYLLEILSMLYVYATQMYRVYCKGGKLVEDGYNKFGCAIGEDKNLLYLTNLYDKRLRFSNIMSWVGTSVNESVDKINGTEKNMLKVMLPTVNPGNKIHVPLIMNGKILNDFNPNYLPYPFSLEDYYNYTLLFSKEFKTEYNFSVDYFMAFVVTESNLIFINYLKDITIQYKILQRAYSVIKKEVHLRNLVGITRKYNLFHLSEHNLYEEFKKIFNFLTYTKDAPRNIDLWTRGPRKIYIPITEKYFIADYSGFGTLLETIMLPIARVAGETGNKKSAHFEKKTNAEIVKIFGSKSHWIGREKICNNKGECREVDASFRLGKFLFLIECKSVNVSFGFDKGDVRSLNYRIQKIKEGLHQIEDKAIFIAKNVHTLTKPIPAGIEYIIPILATPFPEYIWKKSENLFLDDNLPRILTLKEMQQIKNINLNKLIDRPYTVQINY